MIKRKVQTLFIFLSVLLCISGCEKNPLKVKRFGGRVMDYYSEQGIADATVAVFDETLPIGQSLVASTQTDTQGYFEFKVYAENGKESLMLIAGKEPYYKTPVGQEKSNMTNTIFRTNELYLVPPAYIRFHIKNVSPYDENDLIEFKQKTYKGTNIDTLLEEIKFPAKRYATTVDAKVTKNGMTKIVWPSSEIMVEPFDTLTYFLQY